MVEFIYIPPDQSKVRSMLYVSSKNHCSMHESVTQFVASEKTFDTPIGASVESINNSLCLGKAVKQEVRFQDGDNFIPNLSELF